MPGTLHGVGYYPNHIAGIMSLIQLSNSLGGTFATTIMLSVFNNKLSGSGISFVNGDAASFEAIAGMSAQAQGFLREHAKEGITLAFFAISAFMWLGTVLCAGLGNVWIGKKGEEDEVARGSYVGSLMRRKGDESKV